MRLYAPVLLLLILLAPFSSTAAITALDYEDLQFPLAGRFVGDGAAATPEDREWIISPSPAGIGIMPPPRLTFDAPGPILHDPANIVEVDVATSGSVAFVLTGSFLHGGTEVFPARQVTNEAKTLRWALTQRIGRADHLTSFTLAAQAIPDTPHHRDPVVVAEPRVVDAQLLSDMELVAASPYRALIPNYLMPATPTTTLQEVSIVLPGIVAMRSQGTRIGLLLDGQRVANWVLEVEQAADAQLYVRTVPLPAYGHPGDQRLLQLLLQNEGEEFLVLEERRIQILSEGRDFGQFEQPYRSIRDYEVAEADGDMLVAAILVDLYSQFEPELAATSTHDVIANLLSPHTGRFETETIWRMSAREEWAAAGFRTLAIARSQRVHALFASGTASDGLESVGVAATSGSGTFRPIPMNPIIKPTGAFSGHTPDQPFALRGNGVVSYGQGYAMLSLSQVLDHLPRVLAFVSPDMRYWVEAGIVPIDLPADTRHLALARHGDFYYILTDDPGRLWVSDDPLRHWQAFSVGLPTDWRAFRLREVNGTFYIFGLFDFEGRAVLRWREVTWSAGQGVPLPQLAEEPSPTKGF